MAKKIAGYEQYLADFTRAQKMLKFSRFREDVYTREEVTCFSKFISRRAKKRTLRSVLNSWGVMLSEKVSDWLEKMPDDNLDGFTQWFWDTRKLRLFRIQHRRTKAIRYYVTYLGDEITYKWNKEADGDKDIILSGFLGDLTKTFWEFEKDKMKTVVLGGYFYDSPFQ